MQRSGGELPRPGDERRSNTLNRLRIAVITQQQPPAEGVTEPQAALEQANRYRLLPLRA